MTQDELKLVLEALKWCHGGEPCGTAEAIAAIKKALAQPEQPKVRTGGCLLVGVFASDGHKIQKAQPEQEPVAIGDIRALKHRIHELEGEVIGYKRILDAQPEQEPVAYLCKPDENR